MKFNMKRFFDNIKQRISGSTSTSSIDTSRASQMSSMTAQSKATSNSQSNSQSKAITSQQESKESSEATALIIPPIYQESRESSLASSKAVSLASSASSMASSMRVDEASSASDIRKSIGQYRNEIKHEQNVKSNFIATLPNSHNKDEKRAKIHEAKLKKDKSNSNSVNSKNSNKSKDSKAKKNHKDIKVIKAEKKKLAPANHKLSQIRSRANKIHYDNTLELLNNLDVNKAHNKGIHNLKMGKAVNVKKHANNDTDSKKKFDDYKKKRWANNPHNPDSPNNPFNHGGFSR